MFSQLAPEVKEKTFDLMWCRSDKILSFFKRTRQLSEINLNLWPLVTGPYIFDFSLTFAKSVEFRKILWMENIPVLSEYKYIYCIRSIISSGNILSENISISSFKIQNKILITKPSATEVPHTPQISKIGAWTSGTVHYYTQDTKAKE